jgi:hypothetical protein
MHGAERSFETPAEGAKAHFAGVDTRSCVQFEEAAGRCLAYLQAHSSLRPRFHIHAAASACAFGS